MLTTSYKVSLYAYENSPLLAIIPLLPVIIKGVLVILGLVVANVTISKVTDLFWGPPDESGKRQRTPFNIPMGAVAIGAAVILALLVTKR